MSVADDTNTAALSAAAPGAGASLPSDRARRGWRVVRISGILAVLAFVLSLALGPVAIGPGQLFAIALKAIGLGEWLAVDPRSAAIVEAIRAPRALLGLAVGAALASAGAVMQGFFRNPLADPALIGVSAGGAAAAVGVIVLGAVILGPLTALLGAATLPLAAFAGSLAAVAAIYRIAQLEGRVIVATMLLAGVGANALAFAAIGYFTFLADDDQLRTLTFWTLGSLGGATWDSVTPAIAIMVLAALGLQTLARPLNCLLLGDQDARHLGVDTEAVKRRAALLTALGVGAATAACGVVGFVGLVAPHLARLMTGPDHRYVLPASAFIGAALVLFADLVARVAAAPAELPLGVVTAALGAPFFFWLLWRDKRKRVEP